MTSCLPLSISFACCPSRIFCHGHFVGHDIFGDNIFCVMKHNCGDNMFVTLDDEFFTVVTHVSEFRHKILKVVTLVRRRPRRKATGMKVHECKTAGDLACSNHNRKVQPFLTDCFIVGQHQVTESTHERRGSASTKRSYFHTLDIAIVLTPVQHIRRFLFIAILVHLQYPTMFDIIRCHVGVVKQASRQEPHQKEELC